MWTFRYKFGKACMRFQRIAFIVWIGAVIWGVFSDDSGRAGLVADNLAFFLLIWLIALLVQGLIALPHRRWHQSYAGWNGLWSIIGLAIALLMLCFTSLDASPPDGWVWRLVTVATIMAGISGAVFAYKVLRQLRPDAFAASLFLAPAVIYAFILMPTTFTSLKPLFTTLPWTALPVTSTSSTSASCTDIDVWTASVGDIESAYSALVDPIVARLAMNPGTESTADLRTIIDANIAYRDSLDALDYPSAVLSLRTALDQRATDRIAFATAVLDGDRAGIVAFSLPTDDSSDPVALAYASLAAACA